MDHPDLEAENIDQMHVVYLWRSIYEFSGDFVKKLNQDNGKDNVKSKFDPITQTFTLDGSKGDTVKVLDGIRKAARRAYEEDKHQYRHTGIAKRIRRTALSEVNPPEITWDYNDGKPDAGIDQELTKFTAENDPGSLQYVKIWMPKRENDFDKILHPPDEEADVPTMIARICDCIINTDVFKKRLTIHTSDPDILDLVVRKLNYVENISSISRPKITALHLVHVHDKKDFALRILSLRSQISTIGKTTLLHEKARKYYADRASVHSLRLLRGKPDEKPAVVPLSPLKQINGDRTKDGPRAWAGYLYKGWGSADNNPENYINTQSQKRSNMQRNAEKNRRHAEELSHALQLIPNSAKGELLVPVDDEEEFELGPRPNFGKPPGLVLPPELTFDDDPNAELVTLGPKPKFWAKPEEVQKVEVLPAKSNRILTSLPLPVPATPTVSTNAAGPSNAVASSSKTGPKSAEQSLPVRPEFPLPSDEEEFIMPPRPNFTKPGPGRPGRATRATYTVRGASNQQSEVSTREYRNVGQQKKPKKNKDDPPTYNAQEHYKNSITRMYEAFEPGFEYAKLHRCKLTFEAKLGRVIFNHAPRATRSMTWESLNTILNNVDDRMKAIFTDRLTTDFVDADYITDVKIGPEENMFGYEPEMKSVWYEFACVYGEKEKPCILKFDAETSEIEIFGQLETHGRVYWHHPLRCWDASYALQSRKVLSSEDTVFRSLADTFYTLDQALLPEICFRTECSDLAVVKVRCKRESRFAVLPERMTGPDHEFELVITEVQELFIQENEMSGESFRALATDRENMIQNERLYYTFSLVPTKMNKVFAEHTKLEIGEEAEWDFKSVVGRQTAKTGLFESMHRIVSTIIDRIDDVGFNNQGAWQQ